MNDSTLCRVAALIVQAIGAHGAMVAAAAHAIGTQDPEYRERMVGRVEQATDLLAKTQEELRRMAEEVTS